MSSIFWKRFYDLCEANGTKPNPVADAIGVSSGIVTRWKTKGTIPNGETLIKISDYFGCSVDYLLNRTDSPTMFQPYGFCSKYEEKIELIKNIETFSKEKNISLEYISLRCQLPENFLNSFKNGNLKLSFYEIEKIAQIFHCSIEFLLGRTPFTDAVNEIICKNASVCISKFLESKRYNKDNIYSFDGIKEEIDQGIYKFSINVLFSLSRMLEIPVETLTQNTGIDISKILPDETDYSVAAWGGKETEGTLQAPIKEQTT